MEMCKRHKLPIYTCRQICTTRHTNTSVIIKVITPTLNDEEKRLVFVCGLMMFACPEPKIEAEHASEKCASRDLQAIASLYIWLVVNIHKCKWLGRWSPVLYATHYVCCMGASQTPTENNTYFYWSLIPKGELPALGDGSSQLARLQRRIVGDVVTTSVDRYTSGCCFTNKRILQIAQIHFRPLQVHIHTQTKTKHVLPGRFFTSTHNLKHWKST